MQQLNRSGELPIIQLDYFTIGKTTMAKTMTVLVGYCCTTRGCCAVYTRRKGTGDVYVVHAIAWIDGLGRAEVKLMCDQEEALIQVRDTIQGMRNKKTLPLTSPQESKGSMGGVESCHGRIEAQVRTYTLHIEKKYEVDLAPDDPVMPWITRHSAWTINKYQLGQDGKTPHERQVGTPHSGFILEFAECCMFRVLGVHQHKMAPRWLEGVWVGKFELTDEHICLTPQGVRRARSVRRREPEQQWSKEFFRSVRGMPWNPLAKEVATKAAEMMRQGEALRRQHRMYITKAVVTEAGATPGCKGCTGQAVAHTGRTWVILMPIPDGP